MSKKTIPNHIIYARVSTEEQNVTQQVEELKALYPQAMVAFTDKATGTNLDRPEWQALNNFVKKGDTVYVYDISRLGRNTKDVLQVVEEFTEKGVKIVVHTISGIDITSVHGKMVVTVLASVATMQVEEMKEKQAIGIKNAKAQGKYTGGKANPLTTVKCAKVAKAVTDKAMSLQEALKGFGVSRPTYYRWKKAQEAEEC